MTDAIDDERLDGRYVRICDRVFNSIQLIGQAEGLLPKRGFIPLDMSPDETIENDYKMLMARILVMLMDVSK